VEAVRTIMDTHGDTNKPLWLTEIGWSDAPDSMGAPTVNQEEMAAYVKAVYSTPLPANVIFWYNFRNIFANSTDPEHNFGLVNADFSPKPAFKAYAALIAACAR
jgi:polysaccharide biosynthesis protein PslG